MRRHTTANHHCDRAGVRPLAQLAILAHAMIEQAQRDLVATCEKNSDGDAAGLRAEALGWFLEPDRRSDLPGDLGAAFSLRWCCEVLELAAGEDAADRITALQDEARLLAAVGLRPKRRHRGASIGEGHRKVEGRRMRGPTRAQARQQRAVAAALAAEGVG